MTCANCANTVTRTLKKTEGVSDASVNYASERASVTFDPAVVKAERLIERIRDAGYDVPQAHAELPITGMTCANCSNTVGRVLRKVPGVLDANVNLATEKASVTYIPGAVTRADLIAAVEKAGYGVVQTSGDEARGCRRGRTQRGDRQPDAPVLGGRGAVDAAHSLQHGA